MVSALSQQCLNIYWEILRAYLVNRPQHSFSKCLWIIMLSSQRKSAIMIYCTSACLTNLESGTTGFNGVVTVWWGLNDQTNLTKKYWIGFGQMSSFITSPNSSPASCSVNQQKKLGGSGGPDFRTICLVLGLRRWVRSYKETNWTTKCYITTCRKVNNAEQLEIQL